MKKMWMVMLNLVLATGIGLSAEASFIDTQTRAEIEAALLQKYGEGVRFRIERGVAQAADLWRAEDGDRAVFAAFCLDNFVADEAALDSLLDKLEFYKEVLAGSMDEMATDKNQPVELDGGEITPLDEIMNQFDPSAHLSGDLFASKAAFIPLLNFPTYTLDELLRLGPSWNRRQWARARMGGGATRIPADVQQRMRAAFAGADRYISEYNIYMGRLRDARGQTFFPADMKLISHWGLRDELKARYKDPRGLAKQRLILSVMERIIRQEIPAAVINSDKLQWDPVANRVYENNREIRAEREPDTRYQTFLEVFRANALADPFNPLHPTHIKRSFEQEREIPEPEVEAWFVELLSSPQVRTVAKLVEKRLGRKLEPFDIWYPGFRSGSRLPEEELDKIVSRRYPTAAAFEKDLPAILARLGFPADRIAAIVPHIQVDAARGSGHCTAPVSRKFKVRVRTRVPASGMNYKGFNIAMHEFGHAVERVLDLEGIDHYSLNGVPNNAFTEAFAYVFQDRDLDVLGVAGAVDPREWDLKTLGVFWSSYEDMGVSLLDMKAWHWLYDHPQATPAELREAVVSLAREIWNRYYAPVFGVRDQVLLAVYSHMIDYSLYLPHYSIGNLIQFQIESFLRDRAVGPEMARMCAAGSITPNLWMRLAVGADISVKPVLKAVGEALRRVN
jgi:hypothetical protein